MTTLTKKQIQKSKNHIEVSSDELAKIFRKEKNTDFLQKSININRLEEYIDKDWEVAREFKTKVRIQKEKTYDKKFEDDIWCLFFKLGFNIFNSDSELHLPWSNNLEDTKQIDVLAADTKRKIIFLIECKSSQKQGAKKNFKDEIEHLRERIVGQTRAIKEIFSSLALDNEEVFGCDFEPKSWKVKHIFATRNIRLLSGSNDYKRLKSANSFHFDDNTYNYVTDLVNKYQDAAIYQFLPLIFKGTKINDEKIKVPAIKSRMGGLDYYVFSIEPKFLLQIGYVLHRVKANLENFPTYQRLLIPTRLKGIREFLSKEKGFFPNSVLLNFNTENNKLIFEPSPDQPKKGVSKSGILKIPNVYAIAFIIDGQHRVYGYTGIEFSNKQSIPVVAFSDLKSMQQLKIFMEINQNQRKISPSLRLDLIENLHWKSKYPNERMEALRSYIVKKLGNSQDSILYNKIEIGEDKAEIPFKPFMDGLKLSGLLPVLKSRYFDRNKSKASLYSFNADDKDPDKAMDKAGYDISNLLLSAFKLLEDQFAELSEFTDKTHVILSPRGVEALIRAIGAINTFLFNKGNFSDELSLNDRFKKMEKYILSIYSGVDAMSDKEKSALHSSLGGGGATERYCFFLSLVNKKFEDFSNEDLVDWQEKQDESIQNEGRNLGEKIEAYIKDKTINNLELIYGEDEWEWNIGGLRKKCMDRHDEDTRKNKKAGDNQILDWWDYFDLSDYKKIMEMKGVWGLTPKLDKNKANFKTFSQLFSIDIVNPDHKPQRVKDGLKWLSLLIKYRNVWAHSGTKRKRINASDLENIKKIAGFFNIS